MKNKSTLILQIFGWLIILFPITFANAQGCDRAAQTKMAGSWKFLLPLSPPEVTPANLAIEKPKLAGIQKTIASGYSPVGVQVAWEHGFEMGKPQRGDVWVSDIYQLDLVLKPMLCSGDNKPIIGMDPIGGASIYANRIPKIWFFPGELPADEFRGYLKMEHFAKKVNGFYKLGNKWGEENWGSETWLITYDDTLPFYYVSRKEYLQLTKKRLEKTIANEGGGYEENMKNINDWLKKPESELSKPAICMWNEEERFEGFVEEETRGSFVAIKPNMAYFRKSLGKAVPQLWTVSFTTYSADPVSVANVAGIKKMVDFTALREMLGK
jgi:hypothetical protein